MSAVSRDRCGFSYPKTVAMRSYNPVVKGHQGQLKKAMQLILAAERPLIYVGGGVILGNASKVLNELVDRMSCMAFLSCPWCPLTTGL